MYNQHTLVNNKNFWSPFNESANSYSLVLQISVIGVPFSLAKQRLAFQLIDLYPDSVDAVISSHSGFGSALVFDED